MPDYANSLHVRGTTSVVLDVIRAQPGIHFRALGRQSGITSSGHLRHHLDALLRRNTITVVKDGKFSRFYSGDIDSGSMENRRMARLARAMPNAIMHLLAKSASSRDELRRSLGCADSTLGYHLRRLIDGGDITKMRDAYGSRVVFAVADRAAPLPMVPWVKVKGA